MKKKLLIGACIVIMAFIAACDNTEPQTCDCPNEATHLEQGPNVKCPADKCPHTGDCTVKVNVTLNAGGIKVIKEVGVSIEDFNLIVADLNIVVSNDALSNKQIDNFKENFPEVRIKQGTGISHHGKVLTIGCKENADNIYIYLVEDNTLVKSPQIKTQWLGNAIMPDIEIV